MANDSLSAARGGTNVELTVAEALVNSSLTNVETITDNSIGSNFFTPTAGLVIKNTTASTGSGSQTTGQQDPPSIEFDGTYWDGAASQIGKMYIWTHFSQTAGVISGANLYINYSGQPNNKNCWFVINNTADATALQNPPLPLFALRGAYWDGAASQQSTWQFEHARGVGANPTDALHISHYGSTGQATLDLTNSFGTGG